MLSVETILECQESYATDVQPLHSSQNSLILQGNVLWTLLNISAHSLSLTSWKNALTFISSHWIAFIHVRISGTALRSSFTYFFHY